MSVKGAPCASPAQLAKRKRTKLGDVDVSEAEPPESGMPKYSIDYGNGEDDTGSSERSIVVLANHGGGGMWCYPTPGGSTQNEPH